ncbi:translation initiation factor SUI1, putative [Plasmodium ovale curtisi]|uniref:Translation initiation factor SUI1, putative n=1 Tax=Plasmodium ovale curtisi TaxID=864141 RepID=A0A1A8W0Z7_PLAOA|nr:translation initiation factor SUI1, putative [Plasmodium ovale curtisi]
MFYNIMSELATYLKSTFNIEKDEEVDEILDKEDTSVCKVQKTKITVYLSKNIPVLFSVQNVIFPTVYTLWKFPHIIPCFVIYPPASEFLLRGADLMIPGICKDIDEVEKLKEGNVWGVRVFNNPHMFAVGQCAVEYNSSNSKQFYDLKGKCLKLMHIFNDELWKLGSQTIPHNSFKSKIIDSVEEIIDDFNQFKIYGEKEKKSKKTKKEVEKEDTHKKKNFDSWSDENDDDTEKGKGIYSEIGKDKNEKDIKKKKETKLKGTTSEKGLENFYKHFSIIVEIKNGSKIAADTALGGRNDRNNVDHCTGTTDIINEGKKKANKILENHRNDKKTCTVDQDSIQVNNVDDTNQLCNTKNVFTNDNMLFPNKEKNIDQVNMKEQISQEENIESESSDLSSESIDNINKDNINKDKIGENEKEENEKEENEKEENEIGKNKIGENENIFHMNMEQQDMLLTHVFLEVLYCLNIENLPIEISGIYSKMTKKCMYIHKNENFLKELEKTKITYEIINKIKKKEINLILDIKKSSFKKLIKFIQYYTKIKLIKIKENRNITCIVNINKKHPLFISYKPIELFEKKNMNNNFNKNNNINLFNKGTQILEFYIPSSKTLNIFKYVDFKIKKNSYFNINQVKEILLFYIKGEKLQNSEDNNLIKIDEYLSSFLDIDIDKDKDKDKDNKHNIILPYDFILNKFISILQPCYAIVKPNTNFDIEPLTVTKGVCPSIHIYSVARMKGKKYITHITNLYLFHVDLNKFSEFIQKQLACSCSTAISPSTKKEEVLVQGNVVTQIYDILTGTYFLPRKYIVLNVKGL